MANITPSGTVMSVVITPSFNVCNSAVCSAASCQTDLVGSPKYHRAEKPCHTVRDRPSLKEKMTAISTGISDQARYPNVTATRIRGGRHGSFHHATGLLMPTHPRGR